MNAIQFEWIINCIENIKIYVKYDKSLRKVKVLIKINKIDFQMYFANLYIFEKYWNIEIFFWLICLKHLSI